MVWNVKNGVKKKSDVKAIDIIPQEYYKNILEGACNMKEKYIFQRKCICNGLFKCAKVPKIKNQ